MGFKINFENELIIAQARGTFSDHTQAKRLGIGMEGLLMNHIKIFMIYLSFAKFIFNIYPLNSVRIFCRINQKKN